MKKTKSESAQTRERILDAAETEMLAHGVTQTSLARIATRAEVTRGAIYWHFADKTALLEAMIRRTKLPMRDLRQCLGERIASDPLRLLREMILHGIARLTNDAQHRRVCHIVLHRCEMTEQGNPTASMLEAMFNESHTVVRQLCEELACAGQLREGMTTVDAADVVMAFIVGMYECSLRHPGAFAIDRNAELKVDAVLSGLFASVAASDGSGGAAATSVCPGTIRLGEAESTR